MSSRVGAWYRRRVSEERKAILAVSAQTIMAIVTFFVAKDALHALPVEPLILIRAGVAGLLLTALVFVPGLSEPAEWRRGDVLRLAGLGLLVVPGNQVLFFMGLARSSAAHAALLYGLTPALVLLIGRVRGTERLTPARVGGIAAAFAGVVVVLFGPALLGAAAPPSPAIADAGFRARQVAGPDAMRGDLIILVAVFAWAFYTAFSRDLIRRLGTVRATAGGLGIGALLYAPFALPAALRVDYATVSAEVWLALAWLAIASSTLSYLAWYYAIRRLDPSRVAIFNNLQPIGTALVAWALGAPPHASLFLGAALVVSGVLLAQRRSVTAPSR